jgi:hypothetical protein
MHMGRPVHRAVRATVANRGEVEAERREASRWRASSSSRGQPAARCIQPERSHRRRIDRFDLDRVRDVRAVSTARRSGRYGGRLDGVLHRRMRRCRRSGGPHGSTTRCVGRRHEGHRRGGPWPPGLVRECASMAGRSRSASRPRGRRRHRRAQRCWRAPCVCAARRPGCDLCRSIHRTTRAGSARPRCRHHRRDGVVPSPTRSDVMSGHDAATT